MQRGFKTWAEHQAIEQRRRLGLGANVPLPATQLAAHLGNYHCESSADTRNDSRTPSMSLTT
jgi:hypothetical protein